VSEVPSRTKKFRGSRTHGRGKKAGRGKGKRGGRGMAGLCKHRWVWMLKYMPDHWGRHGFTPPRRAEYREINLMRLREILPSLREAGLAREEDGLLVIDLRSAGYGKLLGRGEIDFPARILVDRASEGAVRKVEAAGGSVETNA